MLNIQSSPITRQQFALLMQAKHQIRKEFNADVSLQKSDVVHDIFEYSMKSNHDTLFSLFDAICKAAPEH